MLGSAPRHRAEGRWREAIDAYHRAERVFGSSEAGLICAAERKALAGWLEPAPMPGNDWAGLLRKAVAHDPLAAKQFAGQLPEATGKLSIGVICLLARRRRARGLGEFHLGPCRLPCVLLDERQHLPPGIRRGVPMLLEGAVEERVGRAFIDHHLVRNARLRQLAVELREVLWGRRLVVAGEEEQERCPHLGDDVADAGRDPVKADRATESRLHGGLSPGLGAAKTESDREHRFRRAPGR